VVFHIAALPKLAPRLQSLPPMLHILDQDPMAGYSKGSGVFSSWCG